MTTITLTPSQAQLLRESAGDVRLCDERGQELAVAIPLEPSSEPFEVELREEEAEELASRMSMPNPKWLTSDELLDESPDQATD